VIEDEQRKSFRSATAARANLSIQSNSLWKRDSNHARRENLLRFCRNYLV